MKDIKKHFSKNWKNYLIGILVVLVLGSIMFSDVMRNIQGNQYYQPSMESDAAVSKYRTGSSGFAPNEDTRKVVKNANLDLETKEFEKGKESLESITENYEGYVQSKSERKSYRDNKVIDYQVRINSSQLDEYISELKSIGEVERVNIYTNDVTGEYVDYTDRLNRYKSQKEKYNQMLERENLSIEDEIKIQERIDSLEENIFDLEERREDISERVTYSRVDITLREKLSVPEQVEFMDFNSASKLFLEYLQNAMKFIISVAGFIAPFLVAFLIYRGARRLYK